MEVKHTPKCLELQAKLEEFKKLWPKFCTKCGGYGYITYAATRDDPGGSDPCSCIEDNVCPRCGTTNIVWIEQKGCDYGHCVLCGWDEWTITNTLPGWELMVAPWDGECDCWIEEETNREFEKLLDIEEMKLEQENEEEIAYWVMMQERDEKLIEEGVYQTILRGGDENEKFIEMSSPYMGHHWERSDGVILLGSDIDRGIDYLD